MDTAHSAAPGDHVSFPGESEPPLLLKHLELLGLALEPLALDSFVQLALPVAVAFCSTLAVLGLRGVLVLELLIAKDAR
eukprot:jgi/Chrpa1/3501/Chrysochromulina_OHIO_Genome00003415-RA